MKTTLLDAAGSWAGAKLQAFGIKRGLVALFAGLLIVGLVAALVISASVAGTLWSLFA